MNTEQLFHVLSVVKNVKSNRWDDVREIVNAFENMHAFVVRKKWCDDFKDSHPDFYPLDLRNIDTWSTYDRTCIRLTYYVENGLLFVDAKIFDGDIYGDFTHQRFTATIQFHESFIHRIHDKIVNALDDLASDAYDDYLDDKRKKWMDDFKLKTIAKVSKDPLTQQS